MQRFGMNAGFVPLAMFAVLACLLASGCATEATRHLEQEYPTLNPIVAHPTVEHKGLHFRMYDEPQNSRVAVYFSATAAKVLGKPVPKAADFKAAADKFMASKPGNCDAGAGRLAAADLYEFKYSC